MIERVSKYLLIFNFYKLSCQKTFIFSRTLTIEHWQKPSIVPHDYDQWINNCSVIHFSQSLYFVLPFFSSESIIIIIISLQQLNHKLRHQQSTIYNCKSIVATINSLKLNSCMQVTARVEQESGFDEIMRDKWLLFNEDKIT